MGTRKSEDTTSAGIFDLYICAIFTALTFIFVSGFTTSATAQRASTRCLCTPDSFGNRWQKSDAVFTGTVTDIKPMDKYAQIGNTEKPVEITFHVDEPFKNASKGQDFVLDDSIAKYTCMGYPYVKGQRYLVYAYERRPEVFENWSAFDYPSGTYGGGGVCGGIMTDKDPRTAPEIAQIRDELDKHPIKGGLVGKLLKAEKIEKEEKEIEDQ